MKSILFLALLTVSVLAPVASSNAGNTLIDGVVADIDSGQLMVMQPGGGIAAHRADDGALLWQSNLADRPIGIDQQVLLAQQFDPQRPGTLIVVGLEIADGQQRFRSELDLPTGVEALVDEQLGKSFSLQRDESASGLVLVWHWRARLVQGALLVDGTAAEPVEMTGAFEIDLADAGVSDLGLRNDLAGLFMQLPQQTPETPVLGAQGNQYASHASSDILVSRVANNDDWNRYRWSLFAASGDALGEFDAPRAWAPFTTFTGGNLVYLSEAYERRLDGEMQAFPRAVIGVDLATGQTRWQVEVRDTEYRGPWPA